MSAIARFTHAVLAWLDRAVEVLSLGTLCAAVLAAPAVSAYQYFAHAIPSGCAAAFAPMGESLRALAYYVHLVPMSVLLVIAGYVLVTSKEVRIKRTFSLFIGAFALWLTGNLITWVASSDLLIYAVRTTLWFLEVAFFVLGAYFVAALLYTERIPISIRIFLPLALLAPVLVIMQGRITPDAFQALCDPFARAFLGAYPLYAEMLVLGLLAYFWARVPYAAFPQRSLYAIVASLFMFLGTFAIGSFVAWLTSHYEFLFYGLLALPVFIIVLVYSVTNLELFRVQSFGIQVLIYLILLLISSQFLFVDSISDRLFVGITLVFTAVFGYLFQQSALREVFQRHKIEVLAGELEETNKRQESLIHFVGHEVKGFLTKDQGAFAALAEGDVGQLPETAKPLVTQALSSSRDASRSITDILTASNLKKGTTSFEMAPFDLLPVVAQLVEKAESGAREKGLALSFSTDNRQEPYLVLGDSMQLADHVFRNLIENAVNYTPAGEVEVSLTRAEGKVVFMVKDTGVGITDEDRKRLFTEGGHGKDSQKINVHSTGYGLFIAKSIVEAHKGAIRAESEGAGKGATFIVELPA